MKSLLVILILFGLVFANPVSARPAPKIVCIGTSITYGATIRNRELNSYPAQLQRLVGKAYQVVNYGVSGTCLLRKGDHPYWNTREYQDALQSNPDMVFIELGTNDTKPVNRPFLDEFEPDYQDLIQSFLALPSRPQVILLLPTPIFIPNDGDSLLLSNMIPKIRDIAFSRNLQVIDMHSLLLDKEAMFPDKLHPDADAFTIISKRLYDLVVQEKDREFDVFGHLRHIERSVRFTATPVPISTSPARIAKS
jgi:lysophospholipase L1-like esterase